jgi:hypothetical protein
VFGEFLFVLRVVCAISLCLQQLAEYFVPILVFKVPILVFKVPILVFKVPILVFKVPILVRGRGWKERTTPSADAAATPPS